MSAPAFQFDEVGDWSRIKLEILEKYGSAYTNAFANERRLKKYYIDGFSGAGVHVVKGTGEKIDGSPALALKVQPPFDGFCFIDMNPGKTAHLGSICEGRQDVDIHTGDSNTYLKEKVLPTIQYERYNRALCLLDPYGLHLDWEVMALAGTSRAVDMFLNFPVMDMNRNAIWHNPDKAPKGGIERLNRFWGDETWRDAAYIESSQTSLFGDPPDKIKQGNDVIVGAFQKRLKEVAGFKVVPEPLAMRNSTNAVVYYLFFASAKPVAQKIVTDIFKKYRR